MKTKLWPMPNSIPVLVCNHRFGAEMTFSEQTDSRFLSSIYAGELLGFKNNFRMGAFVSQYGIQYNEGILGQEETGVIRNDMYYFTDMWKNPVTGNLEVIPDYYGTVWTAAGAASFPVNVGEPKLARTPNHGQELYNISGGALGYDFISGEPGSNNLEEFYPIVDSQNAWFFSQLNRQVSGISFRNGQAACSGLIYPSFIAGRNSSSGPIATNGDAQTYYGGALGFKTGTLGLREYFSSYANSSRWWDYWSNMGFTKGQANAYLTQEIGKTLINNGWYHDFIHWHSARDAGTLSSIDEMLHVARTAFGSNFVHTCSNGEALEYMFLRESCQRVIAVERNNQVTIHADLIPISEGITINGIAADDKFGVYNVPLSVRVDLSGTYLAGKNVISSYKKIRSLGANVYIVEVPFRMKNSNIISVVLSEGDNGVYVESKPVATSFVIGDLLTITSDMPTKAVLFSVTAGGNDFDSIPEGRSQSFSTTHIFRISPGKDYRVGLISEFNQCSLTLV